MSGRYRVCYFFIASVVGLLLVCCISPQAVSVPGGDRLSSIPFVYSHAGRLSCKTIGCNLTGSPIPGEVDIEGFVFYAALGTGADYQIASHPQHADYCPAPIY